MNLADACLLDVDDDLDLVGHQGDDRRGLARERAL